MTNYFLRLVKTLAVLLVTLPARSLSASDKIGKRCEPKYRGMEVFKSLVRRSVRSLSDWCVRR